MPCPPPPGALLCEGGVNGRKPSRLPPGLDCTPPRGESVLRVGPIFLSEPIPVLGDPTGFSERVPLLGGVNVRKLPGFPLRVPGFPPSRGEVPIPALPRGEPLISPVRGMPALGRCILLLKPPRLVASVRPPAVNPLTWFRCIVDRKLLVSCWKLTGRAMLLCVPKKRSDPPLRTVPGAAARPLADRLAREGTTGRFPAIMRAPFSCARLAGIALTRPVPK